MVDLAVNSDLVIFQQYFHNGVVPKLREGPQGGCSIWNCAEKECIVPHCKPPTVGEKGTGWWVGALFLNIALYPGE